MFQPTISPTPIHNQTQSNYSQHPHLLDPTHPQLPQQQQQSFQSSSCPRCSQKQQIYILLQCGHRFCIVCITFAYLKYKNNFKQINMIKCLECNKNSQLDQESLVLVNQIISKELGPIINNQYNNSNIQQEDNQHKNQKIERGQESNDIGWKNNNNINNNNKKSSIIHLLNNNNSNHKNNNNNKKYMNKITQNLTRSHAIQFLSDFCPIHCHDQVNYICLSCHLKPICYKCLSLHKQHQLKSLPKCLQLLKQKISFISLQLKQKIQLNQLQYKKIYDRKVVYEDKICKNIHELKEMFNDIIKKMEFKIKHIIKQYQDYYHQILNDMEEKIQKNHQIIKINQIFKRKIQQFEQIQEKYRISNINIRVNNVNMNSQVLTNKNMQINNNISIRQLIQKYYQIQQQRHQLFNINTKINPSSKYSQHQLSYPHTPYQYSHCNFQQNNNQLSHSTKNKLNIKNIMYGNNLNYNDLILLDPFNSQNSYLINQISKVVDFIENINVDMKKQFDENNYIDTNINNMNNINNINNMNNMNNNIIHSNQWKNQTIRPYTVGMYDINMNQSINKNHTLNLTNIIKDYNNNNNKNNNNNNNNNNFNPNYNPLLSSNNPIHNNFLKPSLSKQKLHPHPTFHHNESTTTHGKNIKKSTKMSTNIKSLNTSRDKRQKKYTKTQEDQRKNKTKINCKTEQSKNLNYNYKEYNNISNLNKNNNSNVNSNSKNNHNQNKNIINNDNINNYNTNNNNNNNNYNTNNINNNITSQQQSYHKPMSKTTHINNQNILQQSNIKELPSYVSKYIQKHHQNQKQHKITPFNSATVYLMQNLSKNNSKIISKSNGILVDEQVKKKKVLNKQEKVNIINNNNGGNNNNQNNNQNSQNKYNNNVHNVNNSNQNNYQYNPYNIKDNNKDKDRMERRTVNVNNSVVLVSTNHNVKNRVNQFLNKKKK